jgi:hypothetical protein
VNILVDSQIETFFQEAEMKKFLSRFLNQHPFFSGGISGLTLTVSERLKTDFNFLEGFFRML